MIHECTYCTFQSSYKSNLKSHMKSKHNDKISLQKDEGKPMKNHKQIKKLEMMMKKNFQTGVEIETMKRKVKSLGDGNTNEFKQLAREYVELTGETLPKDFFFNFTCRNPPSPQPAKTVSKLANLGSKLHEEKEKFHKRYEEVWDTFYDLPNT